MPAARDDLEEISEYIAKDDGLAAERFMNDLVDQTLPLAQFPQMAVSFLNLETRKFAKLSITLIELFIVSVL